MYCSTPIYPNPWSHPETEKEIIETNIFCRKEITYRIILTHTKLYSRSWQNLSDSRMFIAIAFGLPAPLIAIHLLWVNLITDSLPAIALGADKKPDDIMSTSPHLKKKLLAWRLHRLLRKMMRLAAYGKPFARYNEKATALANAIFMDIFIDIVGQIVASMENKRETIGLHLVGEYNASLFAGSIDLFEAAS